MAVNCSFTDADPRYVIHIHRESSNRQCERGRLHPMEAHGITRFTGTTANDRSAAGMHLVLRGRQALDQERLRRVRGLGDEQLELLALHGGEVLEHVVGRVLPAGGAPDADAHTEVVTGAGGPRDRAQPVVPTLATPALEAD